MISLQEKEIHLMKQSDRYGGIYSTLRTLEFEVEPSQVQCQPGRHSVFQNQLKYQV